jgi:biotin synthase
MGVAIRHDWTLAEARALHDLPLLDLVYRAASVHRSAFGDHAVQLCSLLSVKTGGCPEDCAYCPQSARHGSVAATPLMPVDEVLDAARAAKDAGATRFCMGAAWRGPKDGRSFDAVLDMVRGVRGLGLEACATLGMLTEAQARRLAEAGLTAYNHNLDTGPEAYGDIVSTRSYGDRLDTLAAVRAAGVSVCCGGIVGMGESADDRCAMLVTLANLPVQPESVPINALVAVEGTPLADRPPVDTLDVVRAIAVARMLMPMARVRLSAGRERMTEEAQLLCMMAGANSIFYGEKLLTTGNPETSADRRLLERAGMRMLAAFESPPAG